MTDEPMAPETGETAATPTGEAAPTAEASEPQKEPEMDAQEEFEKALEAFESGDSGTSYDDTFRRLRKGETLMARVIHVEEDRAYVDLGMKQEGEIPKSELAIEEVNRAEDVVKVGDEIKVVVLKPASAEQKPIVSKRQADFQLVWERLVEAHREGRILSAVVLERVKGGLVADVGVRGFVPASHVGPSGRPKNLERLVGSTLKFKVVEVDEERRKVILSNRLAVAEEREKKRKELFSKLKAGDRVTGVVRRIVDYGVFVDIGGADGLLHVSELDWYRVSDPREVLKVGQKIEVMVLKIDPENQKISLGRRQVLPDPWKEIGERYHVGQELTLPISRTVQSGAFVKLPEGLEAFIPISELANHRIKKADDAVTVGQEYRMKVIDLRQEERRMLLSVRQCLPVEERRQRQHRQGGEAARTMAPPNAGGGGTIGERLGALKGLLTSRVAEAQEESEETNEVPKRSAEVPGASPPVDAFAADDVAAPEAEDSTGAATPEEPAG